MEELQFGIDLGTSNSVIAYLVYNRLRPEVRIARNPHNQQITPSVVHFTDASPDFIVGETAAEEYIEKPERTFRWIKRFMGRTDEASRWPLDVGRPEPLILTPPTLSARILTHLSQYGARYTGMGEKIERAIITVPAYFLEPERQATMDAADIAGIKYCRLVEEPTAAALDYIFRLQQEGRLREGFPRGHGYIAVFDLGGGTFDISVAEVNLANPNRPSIRIVAKDGNRDLGGFLFDLDLAQLALEKAIQSRPTEPRLRQLLDSLMEFRDTQRISDHEDRPLIASIMAEAEKIKKYLSDVPSLDSAVRFRMPRSIRPRMEVPVRRGEFEALLQPHLENIEEKVSSAIRTARNTTDGRLSSWEQVDKVILVGGATRIPAVQALTRRLFGRDPAFDADTDLAVARGAALQAAIDAGLRIMDVARATTHAYGVLTPNGQMDRVVIPQGSEYPRVYTAEHTVKFSLATAIPIKIGEQSVDGNGQTRVRLIKTVNYYHPFLYTDDPLQVALRVDESGLLKVQVTDPRTGETMETEVADIGMSEEDKAKAREEMDHLRLDSPLMDEEEDHLP